MSKVESLGIKRLEAIHYYVRDLERSRAFYTKKFDLPEYAASSPDLEAKTHQKSLAFAVNDVTILCSQAVGEGGRVARWLKRHPAGVGSLVFEVEDIEKTFRLLDGRGGSAIDNIQWTDVDGGKFGTFSITTPFGDTTFRFVQRIGTKTLFPGAIHYAAPTGGKNRFSFEGFDHVTSNFQTMAPALLWMEHVMGFERFWGIEFHTTDVAKSATHGSGLRSIVMWDPHSGAKFANNEPYRPFFRSSQINIFNEEHRGDGVQHVALNVKDILPAVREMREAGVTFMPTPGTYYDALPERIEQLGIGRIDEDHDVLRKLQVLIDGEGKNAYMLQIFLREAAGLYGEPEAGPFFYEIIQRKGDRGFGGGNFRALFESIERQQRTEGRIA